MNTVRGLIAAYPTTWLEYLVENYKIKVTRDGVLASLKYDMIESPMHEPIVAQCRGMVVDVERGLVLAHPYDKFWNYGEPHAAQIDWSTARVQEKLDGSLMILWWSRAEEMWRVSSSGHPTAGGPFGYDETRTFADAFWETFKALDMRLPSHGGCTYMFELCTKANRVIVMHDTPRLVLHGVRGMEYGQEYSRPLVESLAKALNWEVVKEYPLRTIEDCLAAAEALDPIQTEGFVVVDEQHRRIKIKSPAYVRLHLLLSNGMTEKLAVELWQKGEASEVLAYFPEYTEQYKDVERQIDAIINQSFALWWDNHTLPTRKDFALTVKNRPCSDIAFKLWVHPAPCLETACEIVRGFRVPSIQTLIESMKRMPL